MRDRALAGPSIADPKLRTGAQRFAYRGFLVLAEAAPPARQAHERNTGYRAAPFKTAPLAMPAATPLAAPTIPFPNDTSR